jgi:hypothetical protein
MKTVDATIQSLIGWLEYRVENASYSTIPIRIGQFESMWLEEFGTLDDIPQDLKDTVSKRYEDLKANRKD